MTQPNGPGCHALACVGMLFVGMQRTSVEQTRIKPIIEIGQRGNRLAVQGNWFVSACVPGCCTGPFPLERCDDQPASDGIFVNVANFFVHIARRSQIPIVAAAPLPETVR